MNKEEFDKVNIFKLKSSNDDYAEFFIGKLYLNQLTNPKETLGIFNVSFEPDCRNNWIFIILKVVVDKYLFVLLD